MTLTRTDLPLYCFVAVESSVWAWDSFTSRHDQRIAEISPLLGAIGWFPGWSLACLLATLSVFIDSQRLRSLTIFWWLFMSTSRAGAFVYALGAAGIAPAVLWLGVGGLVTVVSVVLEGRQWETRL